MLGEEFRKARSRCIDLNGQTACLFDEFQLPGKCKLILRFEGVDSEWRQGVWIGDMTSRRSDPSPLRLTVLGQTSSSMYFWEDTCPEQVEIEVSALGRRFNVYNIWDTGNGQKSSLVSGAGMLIQVAEDGRVRHYRCNDGHPEATFTHLSFTLEAADAPEGLERGRKR